MEDLTIPATSRSILGKKTRFLRRQGVTPVHLFGHGLKSQALQCDTVNLQSIIARAGMTRLISLEVEGGKQPKTVFIREIQRDKISGELIHIDFYQVKSTEKMKVDIPIVFVGEAPAMKGKGRSLSYVDISHLEDLEQAIYVKDITLSPDIAVTTDPDQLVVKVAEVRAEAEEVVEEAVAEEVVAEEKAEEE